MKRAALLLGKYRRTHRCVGAGAWLHTPRTCRSGVRRPADLPLPFHGHPCRFCHQSPSVHAVASETVKDELPLRLRDAHDLASVRALHKAVDETFTASLSALLEDRRAGYRDSVLSDILAPPRAALRATLASFLGVPIPAAAAQADQAMGAHTALTRQQLREWKAQWLLKHVAESDDRLQPPQPQQQAFQLSLIAYTLLFYEVLLATDAVGRESDVVLILDELRTTDFLEPSAGVYRSILNALPALQLSKTTAAPTPSSSASVSENPDTAVIVGEYAQLDRAVLGDAACRYMGQAVSRHRDQQRRLFAPAAAALAPLDDSVWASFFSIAAITHMTPKLFDLWWDTFLEQEPGVGRSASPGDSPALSFAVAYAGLSCCAQSQDVERAMRLFKQCQSSALTSHRAEIAVPAGSLLRRSTSESVQELQLRLLVKMLSTVKATRFDGGVRDVFVKDVKALVTVPVLKRAPWGVINDLMTALTVPSAMRLLQLRSAPTRSSARSAEKQQDERTADNDTEPAPASLKKGGDHDEKVPFFVWAALLRRCAREHALEEADNLFHFICRQFQPSTAEKRELVEIMMRMYATLTPSDYASTARVFLEHVLRTPEGQAPVVPDAALYNLLIKAADTRNAAMMVFLEACADGVAMNADTFDALLSANPYSTVTALSRKLPHDYAVSDLDAQMRIPGNVDAHARREEALQARQKPLYDSTGDVG